MPAGAESAMAVEYTCPMHPEVRRPGPGDCPKCGMALEPVQPVAAPEANPELADFRRRFRWTLPLTLAVMAIAMSGGLLEPALGGARPWLELLLATPVVLWSGWPFFVRSVQSIAQRGPNMWTLIGLGTGAAYLYSVVATVAPGLFPASFRIDGEVAVYFEAAAVIVSLTLFGQVLELKARAETGWPPATVSPPPAASATPSASPWAAPMSPWSRATCAASSSPVARRLSAATVRNMRQNLAFAFLYNALGVPLAAGVLYPFFGLLLSPLIAALAMSFSSVSVVGNALRLRRAKI